MQFRPCIDIHNGKVKQIVGGSLRDEGDQAKENFVSLQDASFYAGLYRDSGIKGGHVILLNAADSPYFAETEKQAFMALLTYPKGLQVGGGIHNVGKRLHHTVVGDGHGFMSPRCGTLDQIGCLRHCVHRGHLGMHMQFHTLLRR